MLLTGLTTMMLLEKKEREKEKKLLVSSQPSTHDQSPDRPSPQLVAVRYLRSTIVLQNMKPTLVGGGLKHVELDRSFRRSFLATKRLRVFVLMCQ